MNILEEIIIQNKKYTCIQKVSIDSKIIYICKNIDLNEKMYLEEKNGKLEETKDENIKEKINQLIHAKSKDVSY